MLEKPAVPDATCGMKMGTNVKLERTRTSTTQRQMIQVIDVENTTLSRIGAGAHSPALEAVRIAEELYVPPQA